MGSNVAPSRFGLMIVLVVIVVFHRCRLGCRRIRNHSPHPDRLLFSLSSFFVVSVVLVVFVFVIIPPLLIVLSLNFLIVLLVSLASSTEESMEESEETMRLREHLGRRRRRCIE